MSYEKVDMTDIEEISVVWNGNGKVNKKSFVRYVYVLSKNKAKTLESTGLVPCTAHTVLLNRSIKL